MKKRKNILVTGGAGFIGSNLCAKLINEGHEVTCLDNFLTGSLENIKPLLDNTHFKLMRQDIIAPIGFKGDEIFNLACPASPRHYQKDKIKTLQTNFLGMLNVLELAKSIGAKVLQASTSEIYGDPFVHPQQENYWGNVNTMGPRSCYDEGKRCAETLCFLYHQQHKIDVKVIRIFNTYGPLMMPNDGRVVSNFIMQAIAGEEITIYGDGMQTRSFCFVDDLVDGMIKMIATEKGFMGPLNLGNPKEFTMLELAELVKTITGSKSRLVFQSLPQDDPRQRKPDIKLAKERLDWDPKVSLNKGLEITIEYFKNKRSEELLNKGML